MNVQKHIRVGGVDESFNIPWKEACNDDGLKRKGIQLSWKDFGGGTGQITRALNAGEIDVAIVLTEGIVLDILINNQSRIVSSYVSTPLEWGIHVHQQSDIKTIADLHHRNFAISRFGSGSHLMPLVFSYQQNFDIKEQKFTELNHLQGALEALQQKSAEVFFWEKHTTRPYLNKYNLRYVDSFFSPWPAFVIAVNNHFLEENPSILKLLIQHILEKAGEFKTDPESINQIQKYHGMDENTAKEWLTNTRWTNHITIPAEGIHQVLNYFKLLHLHENISEVQEFAQDLH